MEPLHKIAEALANLDQDLVAHLVHEALHSGIEPSLIVEAGLRSGITKVSKRFETGDYFLSELLLAARIMAHQMDSLGPHLSKARSSNESIGRILAGTVFGDIHDLGKNIVLMMLCGAGFETKDLGVNVPLRTFVEGVRSYKPNILAMSALLTTTVPEMGKVIAALSEPMALEMGADGYAPDAVKAVALAKNVVVR